jgi:hypothetical protein
MATTTSKGARIPRHWRDGAIEPERDDLIRLSVSSGGITLEGEDDDR